VHQPQRDLEGATVFGTLMCGFLLGFVVAGLVLLKLQAVPSENGQVKMSFESLASIMLGVAAIVVGIIVPLAGVFAFVFLRGDIKYRTEEFISQQIKEGEFNRQVEKAISDALKDEQGILRQYIASAVEEEIAAQKAAGQLETTDWGFEADEYGDEPKKGES
jgi:hypothetical protein